MKLFLIIFKKKIHSYQQRQQTYSKREKKRPSTASKFEIKSIDIVSFSSSLVTKDKYHGPSSSEKKRRLYFAYQFSYR